MKAKLLNAIMKVRRVLRWLIFASLAVLSSLALIQAFIPVIVGNAKFGDEELYVLLTLVPLSIAAAALVIIVIILLSNSRRNKKILDCIGDRGTPDGGL